MQAKTSEEEAVVAGAARGLKAPQPRAVTAKPVNACIQNAVAIDIGIVSLREWSA